MALISTRLKLFMSSLVASLSANAMAGKLEPVAANPSENNVVILANTCKKLLELESKLTLTKSEFAEGKLLFNLISQISNSPLDYCDNIKMAQAFDDQGGELFTIRQ